MIVIDWNKFVDEGLESNGPVSFTTGVFDGLHRGHHQLIDCLTSVPENMPVVATFVSNPFRLLRPNIYKGDISTASQKLKLLDDRGCQVVILIDFSLEFSKLSGRDFLNIIRRHLDMSHLVLGKDHKLGKGGDTTAIQARSMLRPEGITVDIVEPLIDGGKPVSSTRIRSAIEIGDFITARRLLGRRHVIDLAGIPVETKDNSPYLRRNNIKQVIPFSGGYAVTLEKEGKTFATKIKIYEDRIEFENKPDFQADTLTFNSNLQE
ncbi:MAG: FAD synthetase family protein [Spirochaetales bacterium]|uniref:FAD synthase n=1 Tax=Candidatus Thalassospirochaeta sargassi TaxID=3119039 RepID=A0AAJ1ICY8_9SPIO|nr:FAD synthetase family protein [Spirochaetales bacterium]